MFGKASCVAKAEGCVQCCCFTSTAYPERSRRGYLGVWVTVLVGVCDTLCTVSFKLSSVIILLIYQDDGVPSGYVEHLQSWGVGEICSALLVWPAVWGSTLSRILGPARPQQSKNQQIPQSPFSWYTCEFKTFRNNWFLTIELYYYFSKAFIFFPNSCLCIKFYFVLFCNYF